MRLRRVTSLLLAITILFSLTAVGGLTVSAESALVMSDEGIDMIKSFEGFAAKPYWDVSQYTVGYGTYCPDSKYDEYMENGITEEEAEVLLREHVAKYEKAVNYFADKFGRELTQYQFDALVCFTYNLGSGWIYSSTGNFRKTMTDPNATNAQILYWFAAHCSGGGSVLPGLIRRRAAEANLYINGVYGTSRPENYCYIKYNGNGGTLTSRLNAYDINTTDRVQQIPTYEGYTFDGWFTEAEGGTQVTTLDQSTHGITLYAHWTPEEGTDTTEKEEQDSYTQLENPVKVTVTTNDVNLRKGPGTNYTIVGSADKGDTYTISKVTEVGSLTWGCYGDGWICLDYTTYKNPIVEEEPTEPEETETVTGTVKVSSYLTIRSGAGTGYSSVGKLYNGDKVEILAQKVVGATTWGRIEKGWISLQYVTLDEKDEAPEETVPEETVPEETVPEETVPEEPKPEETPEETTPEETPEDNAPEQTVSLAGKVTANSLLIRKGPGTSYGVAGSLKKNASVTITETVTVGSSTWGKISKGWISMNYVKLNSASGDTNSGNTAPDNSGSNSNTPAAVTGTVDVNGALRIRSGPGGSYSITGYVYDGDKVTITETKTVGSTTWGKTAKGWISLAYVKLDGSLENQKDIRTVTASCLKVRKGAGTGYKVVDYLYKGDKVEILEIKTVSGKKWGRIATGWISLDYTKQ